MGTGKWSFLYKIQTPSGFLYVRTFLSFYSKFENYKLQAPPDLFGELQMFIGYGRYSDLIQDAMFAVTLIYKM